MRKLMVLVLAFLIALPFFTLNVGAAQPDLPGVDAYLLSEMQELRIPGLEAVIVHGDQVVYARGFGVADASGRPVTASTPMVLGSVSKGFTALAVMQLVEAGRIDLDSPVTTWLPSFRLADNPKLIPPDAWMDITVRQLLNHTSGIPEYAGANAWMSRDAGADALRKQVASFPGFELARLPGTAFEYSNANYQTLGLLVQSVSGLPFETYVQENIFDPLEMRHSYLLASDAVDMASGYRYFFGLPIASPGVPAPRSVAPSAFVISTAEDMGHYLVAQMNGGRYADAQLLSASGLDVLHHSAVDTGSGSRYAFGWVLEPDGALSHTGETPAFTSGILIRDGWGVFVVRNIAADQREQRLDEIVPGILNIVQGKQPVRNTLDPSFRRKMVGLGVLMLLLVVGMIATIRQLAKRPPVRFSIRRLIGSIAGLLIYLSLAVALVYAGPISNHRNFLVLFQSAPDQLLLLGFDVLLAAIGGLLQLALLLSMRKSAGHPSLAQGK